MDDNRMSILGLNEDCLLEILKYIIANCEMRAKSQGNMLKYADLVNFSLAHENLEAIFKEHYEDLYKSLEFVFVANRKRLEIDFSELQTTHTGKEGDAFWRVFANAINENSVVSQVILKYLPESYQPNFFDRFDKIKRALNNKKCLKFVIINFVGYSLEDLNNFGHITYLNLYVRMNAEALVQVCKSNPHLETLYFLSTEILGRLSDIAPHCRNLKTLEFAAKPDTDGVEYAPLAQLLNLKEMTIHGVFENGSLLTIFEALKKWKRPCLKPLKITFKESFRDLRNFNIARKNSMLLLELKNDSGGIILSVSYDFWDISRDSSPLEHSLATIPLIDAKLKIDYEGLTLYKCPKSDTDINGFTSILKLFKIQTLTFDVEIDEIPIAKLVASIISDKSYALKSINTVITEIDQFVTSEIVKIKSITSLSCRFSDWESVELLSALTNLETVKVDVEKEFDMTSSKALCSLINTCSASGFIKCFDCHIEFRKIESIISQSKRTTALGIYPRGVALSHIFKAFSYRDLITIEELDVTYYDGIYKDILKMAKVHPIKKLAISLTKYKDIEYLSHLAELEELTLNKIERSVKKFFDQTASPSVQHIDLDNLPIDVVVRVSKVKSLKKLYLEEWKKKQQFSLQQLFSAFAVKTTTRLQHLKIEGIDKYLEISELKELSKIKTLKSLKCSCLCKDFSFLRNFKHSVKLDIDLVLPTPKGLELLAKLNNFESLTLFWYKYEDLDFLLNDDGILSGLEKVILLESVEDDPAGIYQVFTIKSPKLTHISADIGFVEELNEITRIKSLRSLNLCFSKVVNGNLINLGELPELESLLFKFNKYYTYPDTMNFVLSFLKCCRNLDCFSIHSACILDFYDTFLNDLYALLKSVRDPTHQSPLTVHIISLEHTWYNLYKEIPKILHSENAYMKIFCS